MEQKKECQEAFQKTANKIAAREAGRKAILAFEEGVRLIEGSTTEGEALALQRAFSDGFSKDKILKRQIAKLIKRKKKN